MQKVRIKIKYLKNKIKNIKKTNMASGIRKRARSNKNRKITMSQITKPHKTEGLWLTYTLNEMGSYVLNREQRSNRI